MAEKVTTSCLIITFLVYIAPIKYTFIVKKKKKKSRILKNVLNLIYIFFMSFVMGHSPLQCELSLFCRQ